MGLRERNTDGRMVELGTTFREATVPVKNGNAHVLSNVSAYQLSRKRERPLLLRTVEVDSRSVRMQSIKFLYTEISPRSQDCYW